MFTIIIIKASYCYISENKVCFVYKREKLLTSPRHKTVCHRQSIECNCCPYLWMILLGRLSHRRRNSYTVTVGLCPWAETWRRVWGNDFFGKIPILTPQISDDLFFSHLPYFVCLLPVSTVCNPIYNIYDKKLYFRKNPSITPFFLVSSYFDTHPITLLLEILGDGYGPSPPNILGETVPPSLRPCLCPRPIRRPNQCVSCSNIYLWVCWCNPLLDAHCMKLCFCSSGRWTWRWPRSDCGSTHRRNSNTRRSDHPKTSTCRSQLHKVGRLTQFDT